jgi:uncharacterized membrane protein YoaK (UPF0700 family)
MKTRRDWLVVTVLTAILVLGISLMARDIGQGRVPATAAVCFVLLVFLGGVLVGSYGRSKALSFALIACYGATLGIFEWIYRRDFFSLIVWMIFALIYAFSSWQTRITGRARAGSSSTG